ncbi:MAG: nuclear transport factor 2 family protein [Pseudomonadota bacterium]
MRQAVPLAAAKRMVLDFQAALDAAAPGALAEVLEAHSAPTCRVSATAPFGEGLSPAQAAQTIWAPLRAAFSPLQRRPDIFFAGDNDLDGGVSTWVVSMGHLLGLFDRPFCGVRPTRKAAMLRYCEFYRVSEAGIEEITLFLDVLNFMALNGAEAMAPSTAATMVTPGPRTHDGLIYDESAPHEGATTLRLFQRMIARLLSADVDTRETDLSLDWTPDMIWWGPGGIGAPYTQDRYLEQHAIPFTEGLTWGTFFGHRCELAEAHYGGFFGWPTFDVTSQGGYIGLAPKSETKASMRVVDLYRREGTKIAENWNFIDHLHFLDQLGIDFVARQRVLTGL